jgi:hypothetical protein
MYSMKIRPLGAEFHVGGHTHTTKLVVTFRSFAKAPKNCQNSTHLARANYGTDNRYIFRTIQVLVKDINFAPWQVMKAASKSRGIAVLFLYNLGAIWGWVVNAPPRPLCLREWNPVRISQAVWWAPGLVWTGAESLATPPGFDPGPFGP